MGRRRRIRSRQGRPLGLGAASSACEEDAARTLGLRVCLAPVYAMLYLIALVVGLGTAVLGAVLWVIAEPVGGIVYLQGLGVVGGHGLQSFSVSFGIDTSEGLNLAENSDVVIAALAGFVFGFGETVRRGRRQRAHLDND